MRIKVQTIHTVVIILFILSALLLNACDGGVNVSDYICESVELEKVPPNAKLMISHRGIVDYFPENTEEGLLAAHEYGANSLEFDVVLSADDVLVVMHDYTLGRTTNCEGDIRDMVWNDISKCLIDGEYPIPRLDELLPKLTDYTKVFVELKTEDYQAEQFAKVVGELVTKQVAYHRVVVTSFNLAALYYLKINFPYPRIHIAYDGGDFDVPLSTLVMGFDYMLLNTSNADVCMYAMAQRIGAKLITYTVEPGDELDSIHLDYASGIMFDYIEEFERDKKSLKNYHGIKEFIGDRKCRESGGVWSDENKICGEACTSTSCPMGYSCTLNGKCQMTTNPLVAISELFDELRKLHTESDIDDTDIDTFAGFLSSASPYINREDLIAEFLKIGSGLADSRVTSEITGLILTPPLADVTMANSMLWHLRFEDATWKIDYFEM